MGPPPDAATQEYSAIPPLGMNMLRLRLATGANRKRSGYGAPQEPRNADFMIGGGYRNTLRQLTSASRKCQVLFRETQSCVQRLSAVVGEPEGGL